MRTYRLEGDRGVSFVPDVQPAVMRGCYNIRILSVVLDLCGASKPVTEAQHGLSRFAQIPRMDIAIDSTGGKDIWMMGGEIDVRYGSSMALKGMLNRATGRVFPKAQIPDEAAMICS